MEGAGDHSHSQSQSQSHAALVHSITKPDIRGRFGGGGHRDGAAGAQFKIPCCVALEASGSMLVADYGNRCVRRVSVDGRHVTMVAGVPGKGGHRDGAARQAQFNGPFCVAPEASGSMLVADTHNHCVRRVSAYGRHVTTVAGVPGKRGHRDGAAGEAQLAYPVFVALEASGSILVADRDNHCVRRVSADGRHVTTVAGVPGKGGHWDGAARQAQFKQPSCVAPEASGSILVADKDNHCVRRVSADGRHVTTVAGVPGKGGHRDGAVGEAQFNYPECVALGASGSILVADTHNHCVRVVKGLGLTPPAARPSEPEPEPPRIPEAVPPSPSPLQQLCAMGHAREEARDALAAYDGDLAQAGQALMQAASQRNQQEQQAAVEPRSADGHV